MLRDGGVERHMARHLLTEYTFPSHSMQEPI